MQGGYDGGGGGGDGNYYGRSYRAEGVATAATTGNDTGYVRNAFLGSEQPDY
jgi:hypothetical protein